MINRFLIVFFLSAWQITLLSGQSVPVTFEVDMSYQADLGTFDPLNDFVDIAGSFNGWDGRNHRLSDEGNNEKYAITIGGFKPGETIEFKFRIDGVWDGREEFPNGGPNREYTIVDGDNRIAYWYNDDIPPGGGFSISMRTDYRLFQEKSVVQFYNTTAGIYEDAQWFFEGGKPRTTSDRNPIIQYSDPGSFDVQLIVSSQEASDTLTLSDYIIVEDRKEQELEWWNDAVFYEVFVRSFQDSNGDGIGDFQGLIDRLDYLNDGDPNTETDLGVSGIWLMPIHDSPSYHGYDVVDYYSVNPDYGTLDDFKTFLEAAHDRGIKVIIDFVMNHTSSEHPWFIDSRQGINSPRRQWYRWRSVKPDQKGPWGQEVWHDSSNGFYYGLFWSGMPDLNYENTEVGEEMFDIASYWLEDIGVDGFRLDAVKYIHEEESQLEDAPATIAFWKDYQHQIKLINGDAVSVGEAWTSTKQILNYVRDQGLDLCFDFDLAGAILDGVKNRDAKLILDQAQDVFNVYPNQQFATFLTNHDMNRVFDVFDESLEMMKIAASIYLTLPGVPFIYYGEEIGMKGEKPDEFIRRPMQWSPGTGGGFSNTLPWISLNANYTSVNVENQDSDPSSLLNRYKKLISARLKNQALRTGLFEPIYAGDNSILSYLRKEAEEAVFIIINLSEETFDDVKLDASFTTILPGQFQAVDLLNGESVALTKAANGSMTGVDLQPGQVRVLSIDIITSLQEIEKRTGLMIVPNPVSDVLVISLDVQRSHSCYYRILSADGREIDKGLFIDGLPIDLSMFKTGTYIVEVINGQERYVSKFIKL